MGITKIVDMLLDGKDVDIKTGVALLIASIQQENLFLTEYLLTNGCDPTETDSHGKSPLDYAVETNNADLVNLLLRRLGEQAVGQGDGLREPY